MDWTSFAGGLLGGALIGLAAGLFLVLNGRIAGVSGVLGGMLRPKRAELPWRLAVILGLVAGGAAVLLFNRDAFPQQLGSSNTALIVAGLAVGFGTRLGSGCTSGHGVCGIARLSKRSMAATVIFVAAGAATVLVWHHWIGSM